MEKGNFFGQKKEKPAGNPNLKKFVVGASVFLASLAPLKSQKAEKPSTDLDLKDKIEEGHKKSTDLVQTETTELKYTNTKPEVEKENTTTPESLDEILIKFNQAIQSNPAILNMLNDMSGSLRPYQIKLKDNEGNEVGISISYAQDSNSPQLSIDYAKIDVAMTKIENIGDPNTESTTSVVIRLEASEAGSFVNPEVKEANIFESNTGDFQEVNLSKEKITEFFQYVTSIIST